mmetsp:Transcript_3712/g.13736  ORF Transcript_3712/g.13736 Transcript_3712/m.13736 type:complete len:312 (+) Transcript_3712:725-1660(+)
MSSIPGGRPHCQDRTFSRLLRVASAPSTCARHRESSSSFSETNAAAFRNRVTSCSLRSPSPSPSSTFRSNSPTCTPPAIPIITFDIRVTCPKFPDRNGPRQVSTVWSAEATIPITSHPPFSTDSKTCSSNAKSPHSSASTIHRSMWWCRKLLNGYFANRTVSLVSAPVAINADVTFTSLQQTSVAIKSHTLTRFSPSGGVCSPHGVFCVLVSVCCSRNCTKRGSDSAHAAMALGAACRGSGAGSPVSAARNACMACAGPKERFASSTAIATSMTFTSGDAVSPQCAVAGNPFVVQFSSTSFAPLPPSFREP